MSGWTRAHLDSTPHNPIFEADFAIEGIRPADGNADRAVSFDAGAFEFPNAPPLANAGINQTVFGGQLVTSQREPKQ